MRLLLAMIAASAALAAPRSVETILGDGTPGFSPTRLHDPLSLVAGPDGAFYFSDAGNHVVRRFDRKTRVLTTVAGNGTKGNGGDGGLATEATLDQPLEIAFDSEQNLYISDYPHHVVRRVDGKTKRITTIAGTGKPGYGGDGGPAVNAQLTVPAGLAVTKDGALLICDSGNNRIRRIDLWTGMIETFAGTGKPDATPDGAPIQGTPLRGPRAMAVHSNGDIFLALPRAIYKLDTQRNRIAHIAGKGGPPGPAGDGPGEKLSHVRENAKQATLSGPKALALAPDGTLYVADTETHRILQIDLTSGMIEPVAGTGERGDNGVGHNAGVATSPDGDALKIKLSRPHGIVIDGNGLVHFADSFSNRIRVLR